MLTSRSAFQPGEYSATWRHTAQGPLTVLLSHVSETDVNRSDCSVTINCASQKGRHFSEKLFFYCQPGSLYFRASGEFTTASLKSCPTAQAHTSSTKALPSMKQLSDLVPLSASTGHQGLVLQSPNPSFSHKAEPGLCKRQEHARTHLKMERFKGAGGEKNWHKLGQMLLKNANYFIHSDSTLISFNLSLPLSDISSNSLLCSNCHIKVPCI